MAKLPAKESGQQKHTRLMKKRLLHAMRYNLCVVTHACASVGINRGTFYKWYNSDPIFAREVDDLENEVHDFVESKILQAINRGDTVMTIFYAKTKMKHRGYVERTEIEDVSRSAFNVEAEQKAVRKVLDVIHKKDDKKSATG